MKVIHFIGIGGIGVSAIAKYYLKQGYKVSGSDLVDSEITTALKKEGAQVIIGRQTANNLPPDVNIVVYSPAVGQDNPELKKAVDLHNKNSQPEVLSYPQALGSLTKNHFTIAVSGTHGKSTTTSMIGLLLEKAGLDPTVIVGTKLKEFGNSNCRVGKSQYLVIEADEYKESFLNYWPNIIVITNIEEDHLDYYKNLKNILTAFKKYILQIKENGVLVVNKDDQNIKKVINKSHPRPVLGQFKNIKYYSLRQKETSQLEKMLKIPGKHNVYNALAALTVAQTLKIQTDTAFQSLSNYIGSWRRFEVKECIINKHYPILTVHDYAHHPTEVKVTLQAAREKWPQRKIWCVFQPHQYQRTYYLFNEFVKVLSKAPVDRLIIADIYDVAGRENAEIKAKVSAQKLVRAVNKQRQKKTKWEYIPDTVQIKEHLEKNLTGKEIVIIMGAGDIYNKLRFST